MILLRLLFILSIIGKLPITRETGIFRILMYRYVQMCDRLNRAHNMKKNSH